MLEKIGIFVCFVSCNSPFTWSICSCVMNSASIWDIEVSMSSSEFFSARKLHPASIRIPCPFVPINVAFALLELQIGNILAIREPF